MSERLKIGWNSTDITPKGPVMLGGQMFNRLSEGVHLPLSATAMALESGDEKAVILSVDTVSLRLFVMSKVRDRVSAATGIPALNIIASATHTHTAPQYGAILPREDWIGAGKSGGTSIGNAGIDVEEMRKKHPDFVDSEQYADFLVEKLSECIINAWNNRKYGKIAYGMGEAAVGECRRLVVDGKGGVMYADEAMAGVSHAEGHVDHSVNIMSTYDESDNLTGILINLACPAQAMEAMSLVSSDFWGEVRNIAKEKYGKNIHILPQCSPAGDQSPHKILNRKADARMMKLRGQLENPVPDWTWCKRAFNFEYNAARCKEIARRIMTSANEVLAVIKPTADDTPVMKHNCRIIDLPPRLITEQEYAENKAAVEKMKDDMAKTNTPYSAHLNWLAGVLYRYENPIKSVPMELHTLRIGGAVFATNTFELYLDYGDRIKGASKAEQTFLVQLACGNGGTYLPSERSGTTGYGSVPASSVVTFDGGEIIVRESIKDINALFEQ